MRILSEALCPEAASRLQDLLRKCRAKLNSLLQGLPCKAGSRDCRSAPTVEKGRLRDLAGGASRGAMETSRQDGPGVIRSTTTLDELEIRRASRYWRLWQTRVSRGQFHKTGHRRGATEVVLNGNTRTCSCAISAPFLREVRGTR